MTSPSVMSPMATGAAVVFAAVTATTAAASTAIKIATRVESMDELFRLRCGRTACESNFSWPPTTTINQLEILWL